MHDRHIAAAELLNTYGDRLFRYCWSRLHSREMAQIALRDTLLAAQAHFMRLTGPQDPGSFGPWLYSLARAQCRQRVAVPAADAAPGQEAGDAALTAWHAAMSLETREFEALELASQHDVDPGLVLGMPSGEAEALLARAARNLERALGAEILVRRRACPDLPGWPGPVTAQIRERVLEHADGCADCAGRRPRNVSAARVFALLPAPALSPLARAELLDACTADQHAAGPVPAPAPAVPLPVPAPAPAVQAPAPGAPAPAPAVPAPAPAVQAPAPAGRRPRRVPRGGLLIAGAGAIASAVVIASAFALAGPAGTPAAVNEIAPTTVGAPTGPGLQMSGLGSAASDPPPGSAGHAVARSSQSRLFTPPPLVSTAGGRSQVLITAATQPQPPGQAPGARQNAPGQPAGPGGTPASPGTLQLSAGSVDVGTGPAGQITLTAAGGTVSWSASSSSPGQVSLSSLSGTLQAGQSVTLTVTVTRGAGPGSATLSFEPPASAPQLVQVSWAALPHGQGHPGHPGHPRRPRPSPSDPAPAPSGPAPSDPASTSPSSP